MKFSFFGVITAAIVLFGCGNKSSQAQGGTLDAKGFEQQLAKTADAVVLDVRTPDEFSGGHLEKAINVDYNADDFEARVGKMDKSAPYFVYCLSGGRSGSAASWMRSNGFVQVYDMKGGVLAWQKIGLPLSGSNNAAGMSTGDYAAMCSSADKVLIDFYAPWCGPCKKMEPMLEELKQSYEGKVKIIRLNVDENKALTQSLGITEIPVFRYYERGKEVWQHNGALEKAELESKLAN